LIASPVSRPRSRKPATVSASALALHLNCSSTYIGKLEAEGLIQRQGGGFPLAQGTRHDDVERRMRQNNPTSKSAKPNPAPFRNIFRFRRRASR
jgi:hypothetical protein